MYRVHDAALGRWWQVDPKAEGAYGQSPYNSMFNNPVALADPNGDFPFIALAKFLTSYMSAFINPVILSSAKFALSGNAIAAFGGLSVASSLVSVAQLPSGADMFFRAKRIFPADYGIIEPGQSHYKFS